MKTVDAMTKAHLDFRTDLNNFISNFEKVNGVIVEKIRYINEGGTNTNLFIKLVDMYPPKI